MHEHKKAHNARTNERFFLLNALFADSSERERERERERVEQKKVSFDTWSTKARALEEYKKKRLSPTDTKAD